MKIENIIELRKIIVSCVLSCSSFITYKSRLFHFVKYTRMRVSSDPYFFNSIVVQENTTQRKPVSGNILHSIVSKYIY